MINTWKKESNSLTKQFNFDNFVQALDFVNEIGLLAESANHHPDILLHDYKKVTVSLTTHDEEKVTDKDVNLAEQIDMIG